MVECELVGLAMLVPGVSGLGCFLGLPTFFGAGFIGITVGVCGSIIGNGRGYFGGLPRGLFITIWPCTSCIFGFASFFFVLSASCDKIFGGLPLPFFCPFQFISVALILEEVELLFLPGDAEVPANDRCEATPELEPLSDELFLSPGDVLSLA